MPDPQPDVTAADLAGLLDAVGRQDRAAFIRLFEHFAPRIKAMLMRSGAAAAQAEDVAQDTMLTIWRKAHLYDPSAGSAAAWVFTIARNRRIDVARAMQRTLAEGDDQQRDQADDQPLPDAVLASVELQSRVREALKGLNPDQQRVIVMSFFEDRPHAEIAEALGIPLGTVKSRIRLAVQRLRDLLGELQ
ncbi:MAG: sigma-70 family RNA polymerase sigma factor [Hyphomicrobiaceae bacterium]